MKKNMVSNVAMTFVAVSAALAAVSRLHFAGATAVVHAASAPAPAAHSEDEAAIRKLIAEIDVRGNCGGHCIPDAIFWSGAYKQPVIAHDDPGQYRGGEGSILDRAPGTQKTVTTPKRIIISESGDMAYEYSIFTMQYTTKAGKPVKFDGAGLRVWQKQAGQWNQAAFFVRPYDE